MKRGESFHCSGDFGFDINALMIQRPIETNVDSDEFTDMEYLTEGSNSHIFSARWRGQVVIVKMLQVEKAHNTIALNEFEIEVELLSRLNHGNVIRILGAGTKPRPYIILEKLKDLNMMLGLNNNDSSGPFLRQPTFAFQEVTRRRAVRLTLLSLSLLLTNVPASFTHGTCLSPHRCSASARALQTRSTTATLRSVGAARTLLLLRPRKCVLHPDPSPFCFPLHSFQVHRDAMIIHRDLKPENLGIASDGTLKLFDFGLCRCVQKRRHEMEAYEMTGNTGSLRYMAPEVVLNQPYTEKVDVFSFAVVLWTISKCKVPYKGYDRAMHKSRGNEHV